MTINKILVPQIHRFVCESVAFFSRVPWVKKRPGIPGLVLANTGRPSRS